MACAAILLDSEAAGMLTDDRPPIVSLRPTYAEVEKQMVVIREKYSHIPQNPYTLLNTFVRGQSTAKPECPPNTLGREAV